MFRIAFSCSLAACIVAGCIATPRDTQGGALVSGPEASIPFANQRSTIREWQADGVHGIWVQDVHRNWYYGKFHASCFGLDFANVVGFRTGSTGRLDRFSSIEVPDEGRCTFSSFVAAPEPRDNGKRRREGGGEAQSPAAAPANTD